MSPMMPFNIPRFNPALLNQYQPDTNDDYGYSNVDVGPGYQIYSDFSVPDDIPIDDSGYSNLDVGPGYNIYSEFSVPDSNSPGVMDPGAGRTRASGYQGKLQEMLGQFDEDGRFGITDDDRSNAKNQKWAELGSRLAKAGFSHSYQGYGNAMEDLGSAMGGAEDKALDINSTEHLRTQLQKLDMEDKYSTAEKNRMALEQAQNDFDAKEQARIMGAKVFREEMPPEKIEMMVSSIKNPMDQKLARLNFARVQLYMEAGDHDKAMAAMEEINKLIPETIQDRIDKLYEAQKAEAEGKEAGKLSAQAAAAESAPNGYEVSNGNLDYQDPMKDKLAKAQIDRSYAETEHNIRQDENDAARIAAGGRQQAVERFKREVEISNAVKSIINLKQTGFDVSESGKLQKKEGGKYVDVPPGFFHSNEGKAIEELYKKAIDADRKSVV